MDSIPIELYSEILNFLSLKDKINIREVSKIFKLLVTHHTLMTYHLKNRLKKINSTHIKMKNELVCEINYNNFPIYKQSGIHYYFKILGTYDKCVGNCNAERLGHIYHSLKPPTSNMILCNKRYIPYCIHCFKQWEIKRE